MCKCKYEKDYKDYYDCGLNWREKYRCERPHVTGSDYCLFHDENYLKEHEDEVRNEFYKLVKNSIFNQKLLFCIGFHLPAFSLCSKFHPCLFSEPVYFIDCKFNGMTDFSHSRFSNYVYFIDTIFLNSTNFNQVTFEYTNEAKFVLFRNVKFKDLEFTYGKIDEEIKFEGVTFEGVSNFDRTRFSDVRFEMRGINRKKCEFKKWVRFGAYFNGNTYFANVRFDDDVYFLSLGRVGEEIKNPKSAPPNFKNTVQFVNVVFNKDVIFGHATFDDKTYFINTHFNGNTKFLHTDFNKDVYFCNKEISKEVGSLAESSFQSLEFHDTNFNAKADFSYVKFNNEVDFKLGNVNELRFDYSAFRKRSRFLGNPDNQLNLERTSFIGVDLTNVEFQNVKWPKFLELERSSNRSRIIRIIGKIVKFFVDIDGYKLYDAVLYEESLKDENKKHGSLDDVLSVYRMLRDNYEARANYKEAGRFFIGEMELRKKYAKGIEKFIISFYRLSDYGEDVSKPAILLIALPFIFEGISVCLNNLVDIKFMNEVYKMISVNDTASITEHIDNAFSRLANIINLSPFKIDTSGSKIDKYINLVYGLINIPLLVMFGLALRRNFERRIRK